jgi:hypothetical protein
MKRTTRSSANNPRGRRWLLRAVCVLSGAGLAKLLEPAPAKATTCDDDRYEYYELTLERVEALDGGDATRQERFWATHGEFRVDSSDANGGRLYLAPPWWGVGTECADSTC